MKILITGSNGMLAKNIVAAFKSSAAVHELIQVNRDDGDLREQSTADDIIRRAAPDLIIHTAARVGGISANIADPSGFLMDNLLIDSSVLRAASEHGVKDLLYLGSSCMYPRDYRQPLVESDILAAPLEPTNEGYAISKIAAAKYCQYASAQFGYNYKVIVPSNLYGAGDHYDLASAHLVAAALGKAHSAKVQGSKTIDVWGDGSARREFTFVGDLAQWIVDEHHNINNWPTILNVGCGIDHSVTEIYLAAMKVVELNGTLEYDLSKPTGMKQKLMDSSQAIDKFGWKPKTSLIDGMKTAYAEFTATHA
ncbi:NAD-dependent epimerase/dehydratase family protein [Arthrobacter sp. Bz4]|uniref:NAD-dependent epimerase/dehydratase family protein n=1 Tax=Arthrobacter sp. Bz4 TaxID=2171979 RepID=UPI000D50ED64|nr:NAD-dependent epimerase/dehydratase family protein [Arthrobacter sp. Bz4]PVE18914.1 GDP-fucose synthetase [Arthrobacter sp. Bz4]